MPVYFQFKPGDDHLRRSLDLADLSGVTRWQTLDYEFSFHEQHELGWPLYIIEAGKRGVRDRPKINLKDKTASQATILEGKFENNRIGLDAKEVATANWEIFQKLGERYYVGTTTTAASQSARNVFVFKCASPLCRGRTVTQEFQGPAKPPDTIIHVAQRGLGACKQCKQKNWAFEGVRSLGPLEKPDVPLTQTAPMAQV